MNVLMVALQAHLLKRKASDMHPSSRWRATGCAALAVIVVVNLVAGVALAAANPYSGTLGFDISYPQCGQPTTPSGAFAIVGVNGGRPFTANSCFATEFANAAAAVGGAAKVSVYMNLSAPVGKTATHNTSGPQLCGPGDKVCQAHNYGWNAAAYAYQQANANGYARSAGGQATIWWLDIETANSWTGRTDVNRGSIQGATDYLSAQVLTVGIYSAPSMWNSITGSWSNNGHSVWFAGNGSTTCSVASFTGGPLWLVQHSSGTTNGDQGC
jgi:hypothetical protein